MASSPQKTARKVPRKPGEEWAKINDWLKEWDGLMADYRRGARWVEPMIMQQLDQIHPLVKWNDANFHYNESRILLADIHAVQHHGGILSENQWEPAEDVKEWWGKVEKLNDSLRDRISQAGPTRFRYKGFTIQNPRRFTEEIIEKLLDQVDRMVALFRKRGVEKVITETVKEWMILLMDDYPGDRRGAGWYSPKTQRIALGWNPNRRALAADMDTIIHEIGHHVHLSYLHPAAKAAWDKPWEGLMQLDTGAIWTPGKQGYNVFLKGQDRKKFLNQLLRSKSVKQMDRSLDDEDRAKFRAWLYTLTLTEHPATLKPNPRNRWEFSTFRDLDRFLKRDPSYLAGVQEMQRGFAELGSPYSPLTGLNLTGDDPITWDVLERYWREIVLAQEPNLRRLVTRHGDTWTVRVHSEDLQRKLRWEPGSYITNLHIPTEYGKTNVMEDFAETFTEFIVRPQRLSGTAMFRMKQALARSNLFGKKVMRLGKQAPADRSERIWKRVERWAATWDRLYKAKDWENLGEHADDHDGQYLATWMGDNFGPRFGEAVREALRQVYWNRVSLLTGGKEARAWMGKVQALNKKLSERLAQAGPLRFRYKGFVIYNPTRLIDKIVKGGLDHVDQMVAMFRKRGVVDAIMETVKEWRLDLSRHYRRGELAGGWYDKGTGSVTLAWMGDDGMRWGQVDHETLIHEIGHHIHLNYLHPEAKALWDKPWEGVGRFQPSVLDALVGRGRWSDHIRKVKEVADKLDIPSEYGRSSVYEDFAETFMEFVMRPHALSETALFRMKQALARSGFYGKKVMRLARKVASRYLQARQGRTAIEAMRDVLDDLIKRGTASPEWLLTRKAEDVIYALEQQMGEIVWQGQDNKLWSKVWSALRDDDAERALEMLREFKLVPKLGPKRKYIRFGRIPPGGRSGIGEQYREWAAMRGYGTVPTHELGLSVYGTRFNREYDKWELPELWTDTGPNTLGEFIEELVVGSKRVFLVEGQEIATGTDGEPLIVNARVLKELTCDDLLAEHIPFGLPEDHDCDPDWWPRMNKARDEWVEGRIEDWLEDHPDTSDTDLYERRVRLNQYFYDQYVEAERMRNLNLSDIERWHP